MPLNHHSRRPRYKPTSKDDPISPSKTKEAALYRAVKRANTDCLSSVLLDVCLTTRSVTTFVANRLLEWDKEHEGILGFVKETEKAINLEERAARKQSEGKKRKIAGRARKEPNGGKEKQSSRRVLGEKAANTKQLRRSSRNTTKGGCQGST